MNTLYHKLHRFSIIRKKENYKLYEQVARWKAFKKVKRELSPLLESAILPPSLDSPHEYSNKLWWCWLQGEQHAPPLCKIALASLRRHMPNKDITIIDSKNLSSFTDIPGFIIDKWKAGIISNTHFSDILRLDLLCQHGGLWLDATVLCTQYPYEVFERPLFVYKNIMQNDASCILSNWAISAEKNNTILIETRKLLYAYWKSNNYLQHYFIFHFIFTLVVEKYPKLWEEIPCYSNIPPHIMQFELTREFSSSRFEELKRISNLHKLTHHINFSPNNNTLAAALLNGKVKA